jgi:hypothetical protein
VIPRFGIGLYVIHDSVIPLTSILSPSRGGEENVAMVVG